MSDRRCQCGHFEDEHGPFTLRTESGRTLIDHPASCTGAYFTASPDGERFRVHARHTTGRTLSPSERVIRKAWDRERAATLTALYPWQRPSLHERAIARRTARRLGVSPGRVREVVTGGQTDG